jgi:hypothetical protein
MIESLKMKLIESEHPVGVKRSNKWILPPRDFAYGRKETPDKEGAGECNFIFFIFNIFNISNKKLENTSTIKI